MAFKSGHQTLLKSGSVSDGYNDFSESSDCHHNIFRYHRCSVRSCCQTAVSRHTHCSFPRANGHHLHNGRQRTA
ncbi:hypothetical protein BC628DRAFT_1094379 [Trametes gibbosa]|nr:hypothetical protein BC628DRAFT_1094379 [Trametes gibbosa]